MTFAAANGWHPDKDIMRDVKAPVPKNRIGFKTWGEEQIETYRARYCLGTVARLALELVLNTVQRPGEAAPGPDRGRPELPRIRAELPAAVQL